MNPSLEGILNTAYGARRKLALIATVLTGIWVLLYLLSVIGALVTSNDLANAVVVPAVLLLFGGVGLALSLRALVPLWTLANAPITRIYRERPQDVAWVYGITTGQIVRGRRRGEPIRSVVVELADGTQHHLKVVLTGLGSVAGEEMLVKFLLAGAPNAKFGRPGTIVEPAYPSV